MLPLRPAIAAFCIACLPGACAEFDVPNLEASVSVESRDAPWPLFLPMETVLADNPADFEAAMAGIRATQGRVATLKRRARILRAPVPQAQEAIRAFHLRQKTSG